MLRRILHELQHHIPFTLVGTIIGIGVMLGMIFGQVKSEVSLRLFEISHPLHVALSAIVTTSMYRLYGKGKWWAILLIGYVGSVGIGTLSDCIIPYIGEVLMHMPDPHPHIGFIEEWFVVNPAALLGIGIGWAWPHTKLPHAGHVLVSTAASLFHMTGAMGTEWAVHTLLATGLFLFLAVWIPCCTSDIVFPLLFVKPEDRPPCKHCHRKSRKETHKTEN